MKEFHGLRRAFAAVLGFQFVMLGIVPGAPAAAQSMREATLFSAAPVENGTLRLRAMITPQVEALLSSQIFARINTIGPNDGERFKSGDVLVEFSCAAYRAELGKAEAEREAASKTLKAKSGLAKLGAISALEVDLADADHKRAGAVVLVAGQKVGECRIEAPFDGRVVRRIANAHESVSPGDPLIDIVSDQDLEVRVNIPSTWIRGFAPGVSFRFWLDEVDSNFEAEVIAAGAKIDAVSQTVEIRARILGDRSALVAGMSGEAELELPR